MIPLHVIVVWYGCFSYKYICFKTNKNLICIILRCLRQGEFMKVVASESSSDHEKLYNFSTGREKQFSCDQWACNWQIKITLLNKFHFQSRYLAVQVEIWKSSNYNQYNPWSPDLKKKGWNFFPAEN